MARRRCQAPGQAGGGAIWEVECMGRPVDRYGRLSGTTCGQRRASTLTGLRASGWRLRVARGRVVDAMCPSCARPGIAPTATRKAIGRRTRDPERLFELGEL